MKYPLKLSTMAVLALVFLFTGCQQLAEQSVKTEVAVAPQHVVVSEPVVAPKPVVAPVKTPPPAHHMISTANPLASEAGREILRNGGSAVDAAIAAQMVLNLVEPQSSGIGGGGFLVHFNAKSGNVSTYDGRETAPAAANPKMFLDAQGKPLRFHNVAIGGLAVGVPGLLRMLEIAHLEHGKLPWSKLFEPAIRLAEDGFAISERLHMMLSGDELLRTFPQTAGYFFTGENDAKTKGTRLANKALADVLRLIADNGADAFYQGKVADDIAAAVRGAGRNPGFMQASDMAAYKAIKRDPVCLLYRVWMVCGMGPPSSGGITTLQILGILQNFDLAAMKPDTNGVPALQAVHIIAEASRLAFADRNVYIADPRFIPVPVTGLLDPGYLKMRAESISTSKSMGKAEPGMPATAWLDSAPGTDAESVSTTHLSVVDDDGNSVSMTSSINGPFGSHLMVRGFLLNNQLADFSFKPAVNGSPVANRADGAKRPRSSMSPTMIFDNAGHLLMALGSPGGSNIIGYVVKNIVATLDWGLDVQQAIDMPNFTNRNGSTDIEAATAIETLAEKLKAMQHEVRIKTMNSGVHAIMLSKHGLSGGADKRREGVALGD